jgi:hypothetical protein
VRQHVLPESTAVIANAFRVELDARVARIHHAVVQIDGLSWESAR